MCATTPTPAILRRSVLLSIGFVRLNDNDDFQSGIVPCIDDGTGGSIGVDLYEIELVTLNDKLQDARGRDQIGFVLIQAF